MKNNDLLTPGCVRHVCSSLRRPMIPLRTSLVTAHNEGGKAKIKLVGSLTIYT